MPVLRKRALAHQDKLMQVNGLYVHSSPPRVLQINSAHIKQLIKGGDIDKLEQIVLEGRGRKLIGEYSADYKVRSFLKSVPTQMSKISLLHDAVNSGRLEELQALLEEEPEKKKKLVLAKDESGVGLLHKAVYYDLKDIAKWLIENFPHTVHMKDAEGRTPYHYTPMCRDKAGMQKLLKNAGADPSAVDFRQRSSKYYLDHMSELELPSPHKTSSNSRKSTANKESLNIKKSNIRIWIHQRNLVNLQQVVWEGHGSKLLVEHSNNAKVRKFLEAVPHIMSLIKDVHCDVQNDDLNSLKSHTSEPIPPIVLSGKDINGLTPLHKASGLGRQELAEYIIATFPKSVSIIDNEGRTPLHYAALAKDGGQMFDFLLASGADESVLDNKQKTAAFYKTRGNEIDSKLLHVIPECPRMSRENFPPNWDWSLLGATTPTEDGVKNGDGKKANDTLFGNSTEAEDTQHQEEELKNEVNDIETNGEAHEDVTNVDENKDAPSSDVISNDSGIEKEPEEIGNTEDAGVGDESNEEAAEVEENKPEETAEVEENKPEEIAAVEENNSEESLVIEESKPEETENVEEIETENEEIKDSQHIEESESVDSNEPEILPKITTEETKDPDETEDKPNSTDEQETENPHEHLIENSQSECKEEAEHTTNIEETAESEPHEIANSPEIKEAEEPGRPKTVFVRSSPIKPVKNESELSDGEGVIEGIVNGENEVESVNEEGQGKTEEDQKASDLDISAMIEAGNMEQLASLVLNGEGEKLVGQHSTNPELQSFLENVPIYMSKINRIHVAARDGSLKDLQAALDRRKFAIAKDAISPNGASPLHVSTIFGNTSIVRYLAGRFPETVSAVDDNGRTPLHYAATVGDNGHYYNLLVHLGANIRTEDAFGHIPDYYKTNQEEFSHRQLLQSFGADDGIVDDMLSDKGSPSNNTQVEMPFFCTEEGRYLASSLGDPLIKGLTEVANKRPDDPIAYLATYLYNFANNNRGKSRGKTQETQQFITGPPEEAENNDAVPASIDVVTLEPEKSENEEDSAFSATSRDEHGQSMLHFAAARSHGRNALFQLLIETEINIGYRDELYRTARDISIQASISENTTEIDKYVMHIATKGDTDKLVELLLDGFDHIIDLIDEDGIPILEAVSSTNQPETVAFLQSILAFEERRERVHHCIREGALNDVKLMLADENDTGSGKLLAIGKNSYGRCTLHIAVLCQQEEIVDYLANTFPDTLKIGDNLERTALHYAMGVEKIESISRVLIKAGAKRVIKDLKGRQPTYYFMNKSDILRLQEEEETF